MNPITCPHCETELTDAEILSLYGRRNNNRRVTPPKAGPGRPALPRCACGAFTINQAEKLQHVCEEVANANKSR